MSEEETAQIADKIQLTITTPRGVKFEEPADMVTLRAIDGVMGILPGHARVSTILGDGILRISNDGEDKLLAVFGGIAEINNDKIDIYSTIAQPPEEIDLDRAEEDRERARKALEERPKDPDFDRARLMIRRSLVRIEIGKLEDSDSED